MAAEAAVLSDVAVGSVGGAVPVRRQRVRVPMRLVVSPCYQDVALSVYVKVKALASRPEGCQARSATIASYLGLSSASVERGMTQLLRPGPDGVVELFSERRTLPGGRGLSARRTVRPMSRTETFVWVPVAAAEDLTPRQLRAYALIAYAQVRGIALTEAELAAGLRHHSGKKAGESLSVTAASAVVDEVEAARWVTVQRRAGARGRNLYIAHDIAPESRPDSVASVPGGVPESVVTSGSGEAASSQVGEGSGSPVGEGSLAYEESPRTDSPDDARALLSPAVGEVPVVRGARPAENPAVAVARTEAGAGLALRAGGNTELSSSRSKPGILSSRGQGYARSSYDGPRLSMSPQIYAVLEPVRLLLQRVNNDFVVRKIAREVGRQLRDGTAPERLQHRLTTRLAQVVLSDIRDPGRWLLGVALPRWGCGYHDCEAGILWTTGQNCEVCAEIIQDKAAARQRGAAGTHAAGSGRCPVIRTRAVGAEAQVAPGTSVPKSPVVCGVCRTTEWVDSMSGVCGSCAQEMRGLLAPEMEHLDGDGQRLLMRLVSGSEQQVSSQSWRCKVPSCGRRQTGVPPASGRCAPCDRVAAGKPSPWEDAREHGPVRQGAEPRSGETKVVPPIPAGAATAAFGHGSGGSHG
ncbi:hypothetical protein AB0B12_37880 [Streptomyces sp. NPDC044780]|uniref:hypothetical protein n=1 Tax=unclassified Streptomyces TaxID=2593676 RepID=UPI0033E34E23